MLTVAGEAGTFLLRTLNRALLELAAHLIKIAGRDAVWLKTKRRVQHDDNR